MGLSKRRGNTGEWRKLHNEELNDLYYKPNIVRVMKSRRMRWAVHPEGKVPIGRPRRRWEDCNGTSGSGMWGYRLDRSGSG